MKNISLIIPCYNECDNLSHLIARIDLLVRASPKLQVILVNNGSIDNTKRDLEEYKDRTYLKVIHIETNEGYGAGILEGLENADGDTLCWTHADLQTDPLDLVRCLETYNKYSNKSDMEIIVKGRRRQRFFLDACFSKGMELVVFLFLGIKISDINAQPKIFSRKFYEEKLRGSAPKDFSLDLYLLAVAKKSEIEITEESVYFRKRMKGEAKGGGSFKTKIKLVIRTFSYIIALRRSHLFSFRSH